MVGQGKEKAVYIEAEILPGPMWDTKNKITRMFIYMELHAPLQRKYDLNFGRVIQRNNKHNDNQEDCVEHGKIYF